MSLRKAFHLVTRPLHFFILSLPVTPHGAFREGSQCGTVALVPFCRCKGGRCMFFWGGLLRPSTCLFFTEYFCEGCECGASIHVFVQWCFLAGLRPLFCSLFLPGGSECSVACAYLSLQGICRCKGGWCLVLTCHCRCKGGKFMFLGTPSVLFADCSCLEALNVGQLLSICRCTQGTFMPLGRPSA